MKRDISLSLTIARNAQRRAAVVETGLQCLLIANFVSLQPSAIWEMSSSLSYPTRTLRDSPLNLLKDPSFRSFSWLLQYGMDYCLTRDFPWIRNYWRILNATDSVIAELCALKCFYLLLLLLLLSIIVLFTSVFHKLVTWITCFNRAQTHKYATNWTKCLSLLKPRIRFISNKRDV